MAEQNDIQNATINPGGDSDPSLPEHTPADIQGLMAAYIEKRLDAQTKFYQDRIHENQVNSDFTFKWGTGLMLLASFLATFSALAGIPVLAIVTALLPVFAATLVSFQQLYGWDRQIPLYRDALDGIDNAKLMVPPQSRWIRLDLTTPYANLVEAGEKVLNGEVNQWGQAIVESSKAKGPSVQTGPLASPPAGEH